MKRCITYIALPVLLTLAGWFAFAHFRLTTLHDRLLVEIHQRPEQFLYSEPRLDHFAVNSRLQYIKSLLPIMKKPWRTDHRLYFTEHAYATFDQRTGSWFIKWP